MEFPRIDRTKIELVDEKEPQSDYHYWMSRTPEERLAQVEFLRQLYYGPYDETTARLERVLEIVENPWG